MRVTRVQGNNPVQGNWKNYVKNKYKIKALFLHYGTEYTCPHCRGTEELGQRQENISMSSEDEENISKSKSPRIRFWSLGWNFYVKSTSNMVLELEIISVKIPSYKTIRVEGNPSSG